MLTINKALKILFYISVFSSSLQDFSADSTIRIYANIVKILPLIFSYLLIALYKKPIKKYLILPSLAIILICLSRYLIPDVDIPIYNSYSVYNPNPNIIDIQLLNQIVFALFVPIFFEYRPTFSEKIKAYWCWLIISFISVFLFFKFPYIYNPANNADFGITSGFVGNPNSFSLLCDLIVVDLVSMQNKPKFFSVLIIGLLILANLSGSLLGVICTAFTFIYVIYYLISKKEFLRINKRTSFISLFIVTIPLIFIIQNFYFYATEVKFLIIGKKLQALLEFGGSLSIDIRKNYFEYGLFLISKNPLCLITGFCNNKYLTGDGYITTLIASFGIPVSFIYIWSYSKIINFFRNGSAFSKKHISKIKIKFFISPYIFSIFLIIISLFTNRLVDYWPFPLLLIYIISRPDTNQFNLARTK